MAKREVISLPMGRIEVEERSGYLFVVESGQLRNRVELRQYIDAMEAIIRRTGTDHAVIDARGEVGDPPVEVRDAMWSWLLDPDRGFSIIAFVLPTEMAVARVNMTALSRRAQVRAFDSVFAAQRWLSRGPRFSTQAISRQPSSRPPPSEPDRAEGRRPASSPGLYRSTSTPTERPREPATGRGEPEGSAESERPERASDFRTKRPGKGGAKASSGDDGGSQVA
jgi:hypothetical protein